MQNTIFVVEMRLEQVSERPKQMMFRVQMVWQCISAQNSPSLPFVQDDQAAHLSLVGPEGEQVEEEKKTRYQVCINIWKAYEYVDGVSSQFDSSYLH